MYFKGKLTVDPSQLTKIESIRPESSFKKLLYNLTGGQIADKEEIETFILPTHNEGETVTLDISYAVQRGEATSATAIEVTETESETTE